MARRRGRCCFSLVDLIQPTRPQAGLQTRSGFSSRVSPHLHVYVCSVVVDCQGCRQGREEKKKKKKKKKEDAEGWFDSSSSDSQPTNPPRSPRLSPPNLGRCRLLFMTCRMHHPSSQSISKQLQLAQRTALLETGFKSILSSPKPQTMQLSYRG